MVAGQRREREKVETQRRILDAARELFAASGYDAVTMRAIADRIEYTPTALYFHFRDKNQLIERLCAEDYAALGARFNVLARVPDPVERLRMAARAFVSFSLGHPHHYRLLFLTPRPHRAAPRARTAPGAEPRGQIEAFLVSTVAEAADAGRFRRDAPSPDQIARVIEAGMHGVVALAIGRAGEEDERAVEKRLAMLIDALLAGLTRDAG